MTSQKCRCSCGHTQFEIIGEPKFRAICHCTICQKFNKSAYADILVYKSTQIKAPSQGVVKFNTYKPPPNVKRGQCSQCHQAAIEVFEMPLFPKLTMVPAHMFSSNVQLPEVKAHMFYDKRIKDADDGLPKRQGFMSSQLAFFRNLWFG